MQRRNIKILEHLVNMWRFEEHDALGDGTGACSPSLTPMPMHLLYVTVPKLHPCLISLLSKMSNK